MKIYPETNPNTKHCVCNTSWFSKITDIANTVTEMPNMACGKWTCRPAMFVDFLQWYCTVLYCMYTSGRCVCTSFRFPVATIFLDRKSSMLHLYPFYAGFPDCCFHPNSSRIIAIGNPRQNVQTWSRIQIHQALSTSPSWKWHFGW